MEERVLNRVIGRPHEFSSHANLLEQTKLFRKRNSSTAHDCFGAPTWPPFHQYGRRDVMLFGYGKQSEGSFVWDIPE